MVALLFVPVALATPFTVDDNGDAPDSSTGDGICATAGNVCTLRAAIQQANASSPQGDTIGFAPSITGQILLTSALPQITDDLTINGPGSTQLAIDGDNSFRVFDVASGITASISRLTIQHGQAPAGATLAAGGGIVSSGDVTLDRVVVSDNHASVTGAAGANVNAFGGGIEAAGTMTLIRSTVKNNNATAIATGADAQASGQGGGIWLEGGTLHLVRSTIDNNQADATVNAGSGGSLSVPAGGGIWTFQGTITIDQSTIAGNSVSAAGGTNAALANFAKGGGLFQDNMSSLTVTGATIADNAVSTPGGPQDFGVGANVDLLSGGTFRDTIIAEPVAATNCSGSVTSGGYNLEDDGAHSCNFTQGTDIAGQDPMLGSLANNGGPTETRALLPGSPAIDQGNSFGASTDQRGAGFPRIIDSPAIANTGDGADIGAYERDVLPPTPTSPVQSLVRNSQLGTSDVPVRFAWTASDNVTPASQVQSSLQMRTNTGGTWSAFSTLVGPTTAKTAMPSLSGSILRQFRIRASDSSVNFGTSPLGPEFRIFTVQEASPAVAYAGTWHTASQSAASGGAVKYSSQAGAKATLTSKGRNLSVVAPLTATGGTAKICLDPGTPGQSCSTVDLSPATGLGARKQVFVRNGLDPAVAHKVAVTVLSGRVTLDAFVALR